MIAPVRRRVILGAFTLLTAALLIAHTLDDLPEGLTAVYLTRSNGISTPARSAIDARPSTDTLRAAWDGRPPAAFSVTWTGSFMLFRGGRYVFATVSDAGSRMFVDGRLIVDNWGQHETQLATGAVQLAPGVHAIFMEYFKAGSGLKFEWSWARDGAGHEPVPAWILSPRRASFARTFASIALRRAVPPMVWLWLAVLVAAGAAACWRPLTRSISAMSEDRARLVLAGVIAASFLLNIAGIWWGVPSVWAGDEMTPSAVYNAISLRFSGGWWDRYPPFHFFVLSIVSAPSLVMSALGWIHLSDRTNDAVLLVLDRLVSVAAAAGTLIAVYRCGALAFGKRAGLFASGMVAVLTLFVYYAKTANPEVPYVFWFAVSLVFYIRFLQTLATKDIVAFAAAASVAMCTKDQAYGLYLATPVVIVYRLWQEKRARGLPHSLLRAVLDVRVLLAGATVAALFAAFYALPFNLQGFISHVRDITGPGSAPYRMFEPTPAGRWDLLRTTVHLNQQSWGWPLWIASVIGMVVAAADPATRRVAIALAAVMVSYYVGFIDVILYTFDRYILPLCVVEALFGGVALDRFLRASSRPAPAWRKAVIAGVLAYSLLYAATVDVLMIRDSRYAAERWVHSHLAAGQGAGYMFPATVLPRLDEFPCEEIGTIERLNTETPALFILNADYARAVPPDSATARLVAGLQHETLGYHLAFRYRAPSPWPWLPGAHRDLVGPRLERSVLSILRSINPTIEIYAREPS
jgi:hypothetical protein